MDISCFNDFLTAAQQQAQPQRLLLVFASAELPDDCTPEQRDNFLAGSGGALVPAMCVDKTPGEIGSFAALRLESKQFQSDWQVVFAAALDGANNIAPSAKDAEPALDRMIESIKLGALANMLAFDNSGNVLTLA